MIFHNLIITFHVFRVTLGGMLNNTSPPQNLLRGVKTKTRTTKKLNLMKRKVKKKLKVQPLNSSPTHNHFSNTWRCH